MLQTRRRALRRAGHEVYAPTLSGLADRAHLLDGTTGLATHVADVVGLLEYEDLRDVILIGHSYGGMVISGVCGRVAGRIGELVFLDAAIPRHGEALVDVSPGLLALRSSNRNVDGIELALWPDGPAAAIYGLAGCSLERWATARLKPHPWRTFLDRLEIADPEAFDAIPRTIINCTHTLSVRPDALRDRWTSGGRVWEVDAAHDLMLTEPDRTAELLLRVAEAAAAS